MIVDEINEAAALASSGFITAIGTGTGTALATTFIVLMRKQLGGVIKARTLANETLKIIGTNLGRALVYNIIENPIAALSEHRPIHAAGATALSCLFLVTNSLRVN